MWKNIGQGAVEWAGEAGAAGRPQACGPQGCWGQAVFAVGTSGEFRFLVRRSVLGSKASEPPPAARPQAVPAERRWWGEGVGGGDASARGFEQARKVKLKASEQTRQGRQQTGSMPVRCGLRRS